MLPLLVAALAEVQAAVPRAALEAPAGKVELRPLAGFTTEDPRKLGAWIVRFEDVPRVAALPDSPEHAELLLAGGDRLLGRVRGGRAELLDVEIAGGVHIGVAVDELVSLVLPARVPALWTAPIAAPREGDRLYRRQGEGLDTIDGGIEEFTTDGVRFHGERIGSKLVAWSDVAALFIEGLERKAPGPAAGAVPVVVDLLDQGRLRGNLEKLDADGCRLVTHNGEHLALPIGTIACLLVDDGRAAFLSAIPPAQAEPSVPFGDDLGMRWPPRYDRSVTGGPLQAGGRTWARGIGVHAPSTMAWNLEGGWRGLRGKAAIDDEVLRLHARGSAVFRLKVDGKLRWESAVLKAGDPPLEFPALDLSGAKRLELEVDVATDAFVADRADWLELVLSR